MKQHKICRKITFSWELREKQQTLLDKVHRAAIAMEMKIFLSFSLLLARQIFAPMPISRAIAPIGRRGIFELCLWTSHSLSHIFCEIWIILWTICEITEFFEFEDISHPVAYLGFLSSQQCNVSQKLCKFYFATKVQAGSISPPFRSLPVIQPNHTCHYL